MTRAEDETAVIRDLLKARAPQLAMELFPDGHKDGRYWFARNPSRDDRKPGSFWVTISGPYAGAWVDRATDQKGDVFKLIQLARGGDFKAARDWAKAWLGLTSMDPAEMARRREIVAREQKARDTAAAEQAERARNRAFATWLNCRESLEGTVAEVYLRARGIVLQDLPRPPRALRFMASCRHTESGRSFPAIVAAMTSDSNGCAAIHRTFLAEDGSGKAPVSPARKIWPSFKGCAIHLARGESGLDARTASKHGIADTLALVEGIEDGLSLAVACPELRVWAAGSLGNLAAIKLPGCAHEVIVCADNDWGKPGAEAQLARALEALQAQGRRVRVARSPIGKDVNDALRGAA